MGLGSAELNLLIRLKQEGYLRSRGWVAEIGAQQLSNSFLSGSSLIDELARLFNIDKTLHLPAPGGRRYSAIGAELQADDAPRSDVFWSWLGYGYTAIDVDNSQGAIPLDLNFDSVPLEHIGRYDLVVNAGTTEHVANQLNAFKIVHDLTKVGGIMIHRLPGQGFTNHGLVNYNLKFFWMLARSDVYKWAVMDFETTEEMRRIDPDILETLRTFNPQSVSRVDKYRCADCAVTVAMQKLLDIEFVPPLDVRTGENVNVEVLRQRYWTVFDPARVERELDAQGRR